MIIWARFWAQRRPSACSSLFSLRHIGQPPVPLLTYPPLLPPRDPAPHFARIARHLEQEEAHVALRQKLIGRLVLVQDLQHRLPPTEVGYGEGQPCAAPDEAQKQGALEGSSCMASQNQATRREQASTPGGDTSGAASEDGERGSQISCCLVSEWHVGFSL